MRIPGQKVGLLIVGGALGLAAVACERPGDASEQAATSTDALSATAQCVRQASDAELVAELQARLAAGSSSGGVPTAESASATYTCDNSGYLTIAIIAPDGSEKTDRDYLGSTDNCHAFADQLNQTRQTFTHTSVFAICDNSGYLQRFSVTAAGAMTKLDRQYLGSIDNCKTQAATINH